MNAERLHAIVLALNQEISKASTADRLQELIGALETGCRHISLNVNV